MDHVFSRHRLLAWISSRQAEAEGLPSDACRARMLFYARVCHALLEMCPALRQCLDPSSVRPTRGFRSAAKPSAPAWQQVTSELAETANKLTAVWLTRAFKTVAEQFEDSMRAYHEPLCFLELCPVRNIVHFADTGEPANDHH